MNKLDQLQLSRFSVQCHLGMASRERTATQAISVELSMFFNGIPAAESGRLSLSIDYVRSLGEVRFLLENGQFYLIETAAEVIARYLLRATGPDAPRAPIAAVKIRLSKPEALPEVTPALEIARTLEEIPRETRRTSFGSIEKIIRVPDCAVHVITLDAGRKIEVRGFEETTEHELSLGNDLIIQQGAKPIEMGTGLSWAGSARRIYENTGSVAQSILHISHPPLDPWAENSIEGNQALGRISSHAYYAAVMSEYL